MKNKNLYVAPKMEATSFRTEMGYASSTPVPPTNLTGNIIALSPKGL